MYYTYLALEDEIFAMMPKSRRNNEYCRRLPFIDINISNILKNRTFSINYYYDQIIAVLSNVEGPNSTINKKRDHPKGFKCGYDHKSARYCWVNFIPAIFDTRKSVKRVDGLHGHYTDPVQTIEFRPMSASTSYYKIKNWLLICFALVDIVENHKQYLYYGNGAAKPKLSEILELCYPNNYKDIIAYYDERVAKFINSDAKKEDEDFKETELDDNFKIIQK